MTPILREDVECFGDTTCYSLAFGVPAALMAIALVIIVLGYVTQLWTVIVITEL